MLPTAHPPLSTRRHRITRRGFTLLEMLLVLAVLITALMLIMPSITRLYRDQRMAQAINLVSQKLGAARVRAIEDQINYEFRFEPDGRRFLVLPEPQPEEEAAENQIGGGNQPKVEHYSFLGELPVNVQFDPGEWGSAPLSDDILKQFDDDTLHSATWTQPLLFHPDGTSTGGNVRIFDTDEMQVTFNIRQVTGGLTVSSSERRNP